jgi:acyl-CoA thioesterase FadM
MLKQSMTNDRHEIMVTAEVVLAAIDRQTRKKAVVPNEVRSLLQRREIMLNDDLLAKAGCK